MTELNRLMNAQAHLEAQVPERLRSEETLATLERDFDQWKTAAELSMVGQPNPLTGKPHSLSSAKDTVRDLPRYHEWTVELDRARAANLATRLEWDVALEGVRTARCIATISQRDDALVGA